MSQKLVWQIGLRGRADLAKSAQQLWSCKMGPGNEIEERPETPGRRLAHKMESGNRRFEPDAQLRISADRSQRLPQGLAKKRISGRIHAVPRSQNHMIHQTVCPVIQA